MLTKTSCGVPRVRVRVRVRVRAGVRLRLRLRLRLRVRAGVRVRARISQTTRVRVIPDYPGRHQVRALRPDVHIFGHTHWEVDAR